ncbi:Ethylene-responsive transcription factor [Corchorus olitorius]|uniref:Ethylene-responsive transcription factor n=1 Tax=Corchorus olitorius TaxID=93759 RepID=A0A1R3KPM1_9ROSI|nr:Ethylene-responsive transcription factor [Corchorus olitorius]
MEVSRLRGKKKILLCECGRMAKRESKGEGISLTPMSCTLQPYDLAKSVA